MRLLSRKNIPEIINELNKGSIIVFPTETSYGLGCDPTNKQAVNKIFEIKKRDKNKPLLVVVGSVKQAKKYLKWNGALNKIANKYWEKGELALTVVGNYKYKILKYWKTKRLAIGVVSNNKTLALRVTKDKWLKELCEKFGKPVVATSANLAGEENVYSFTKVKEIFKEKDVIIIDGGELEKRPASTLVSVVGEKIELLREGELKFKT